MGRLRHWLALDVVRRPSRGFRTLAVAAVLMTYLLIVWGGVVRVTGSGLGCGEQDDWPLCHGGVLPPLERTAVIEFTHRWLAAMATALVVSLVAVAWARYRHLRRLTVAVTFIVLFFIVQIVLGAVTVKFKLPGEIILAHLANAEALLAGLIFVAVLLWRTASRAGDPPPSTDHTAARGRHLRWILIATGATYLLALSGALVVADSAGSACGAWPLCGSGFTFDSGHLASINVFHRLIAGLATVLIAVGLVAARRLHGAERSVRITRIAIMLVLTLQIAAGALVVELRLPAWTRGVHLALATLLWAVVALLALLVHPAVREGDLIRTTPLRATSMAAQPEGAAG